MQFSKKSTSFLKWLREATLTIVKRKAFLKVCLVVSKYTFKTQFFMIVNVLLTWIVLTRNISTHLWFFIRSRSLISCGKRNRGKKWTAQDERERNLRHNKKNERDKGMEGTKTKRDGEKGRASPLRCEMGLINLRLIVSETWDFQGGINLCRQIMQPQQVNASAISRPFRISSVIAWDARV